MSNQSSPYINDIGGDVKGILGNVYGGDITFVIANNSEAEIHSQKLKKGSPYLGLNKFEPEDKDKFFGRELWINKLSGHLEQNNLLLLLGASGSGKSSLVQAGIIPYLSDEWGTSKLVKLIFVPDKNPFTSLYNSLPNRFKNTATEIIDQKNSDSLIKLIGELKENLHQSIIFIDQFEEIFTITPKLKREQFIANLVSLMKQRDSSVRLIIAMRSDFLDNLREYGDFTNEVESQIRLIRDMTESELRLAIAEPAARNGVTFEKSLVEQILHDFYQQAGSLPLLQYTLDLLWREDKPSENNRVLNIATYQAIGGVSGALQQQANYIYNEKLNNEEKKAAEKIFIELIDIAAKEPVSRRIEPSQFRNDPVRESTLNKLIEYRLLVSGRYQSTVEVAHEELLRCWGFIQNLIREQEEIIILRSRLIGDANQWYELRKEDKEKAQDELWTGSKLGRVLELIEEKAFGSLDKKSEQFIQASVEKRDRLLQEKEERRQRELEAAKQLAGIEKQRAEVAQALVQTERKARRRQSYLIIGLFALLFATGAITWALWQQKLSRSRELASYAIPLSQADPDQSLLLAIEAAEVSPTLQAEDALRAALLPLKHIQIVMRGHTDTVRSAALSSDDKFVVTASADGTARIWEVSTGKSIRELTDHRLVVTSAEFSPNGKLVVTVGSGTVRVWEASTGDLIADLTAPNGSLNKAVFSPDSQYLVTASNQGTVQVREASTGEVLQELVGHTSVVNSVAFSKDSKYVVTAAAGNVRGNDKTARIWEVATGKSVVLDGHRGMVYYAEFSQNGKLVVTASRDGTARVWDASTGKLIKELRGHIRSVVNRVVFSRDSKYVVTTSFDGIARVWELRTGNLIAELRGHGGPLTEVLFSPDSRYVVTASKDSTARVWETETGKPVTVLRGHTGPVHSLAFSSDGKFLITAGSETVRVWEAVTTESMFVLEGHRGNVTSVAFSPNGELVVTASKDGTARVWNAITGNLIKELRGHTKVILGAEFSPDSRYLVTASEDRTARVWNAQTGEELASKVHNGEVRIATFSPDGRWVASGEGCPPRVSCPAEVRVWEANTGVEIAKMVHEDGLRALMFSPNGKLKLLLTGSSDGTAKVWEAETGKNVAVFRKHQARVTSAEFSPDGKWVVTTAFNPLNVTAWVWDAASGKPIVQLTGHKRYVTDAAFSPSPNGKWVATAGGDSTARIWDVSKGQAEIVSVLVGHTDPVSSVEFSLDGKFVVTTSTDNTARVWDAATGRSLAELSEHWVTSAAFSPDGKFVITGGRDDKARVYACEVCVPIEDLLTLSRERVMHELLLGNKFKQP